MYGFTPQALDFFCNTAKGPAERAEDIELLRFIENRVPVKMVEVPSDCVSVDTPSDLELARKMIKAGYNGFGGGYLKPPIEAETKRFSSQFS